MADRPGPGVAGADAIARSRLLLQAAETINSSLDSGALETTILGEAARLTGAGAAVLLVPRGDVLVAREALGIDDRARDSFIVPLETSVFGRALVCRAGGAGSRSRRLPSPLRAVVGARVTATWRPRSSTRLSLSLAPPRLCGDEESALRRGTLLRRIQMPCEGHSH